MDSPDLFAAARERAREMSSPPPAAPDAALLERAARCLEHGGWLRKSARKPSTTEQLRQKQTICSSV